MGSWQRNTHNVNVMVIHRITGDSMVLAENSVFLKNDQITQLSHLISLCRVIHGIRSRQICGPQYLLWNLPRVKQMDIQVWCSLCQTLTPPLHTLPQWQTDSVYNTSMTHPQQHILSLVMFGWRLILCTISLSSVICSSLSRSLTKTLILYFGSPPSLTSSLTPLYFL